MNWKLTGIIFLTCSTLAVTVVVVLLHYLSSQRIYVSHVRIESSGELLFSIIPGIIAGIIGLTTYLVFSRKTNK